MGSPRVGHDSSTFTSLLSIQDYFKNLNLDFPGGPVVKNLPTNAEDIRSTGLRGFHMPQSN